MSLLRKKKRVPSFQGGGSIYTGQAASNPAAGPMTMLNTYYKERQMLMQEDQMKANQQAKDDAKLSSQQQQARKAAKLDLGNFDALPGEAQELQMQYNALADEITQYQSDHPNENWSNSTAYQGFINKANQIKNKIGALKANKKVWDEAKKTVAKNNQGGNWFMNGNNVYAINKKTKKPEWVDVSKIDNKSYYPITVDQAIQRKYSSGYNDFTNQEGLGNIIGSMKSMNVAMQEVDDILEQAGKTGNVTDKTVSNQEQLNQALGVAIRDMSDNSRLQIRNGVTQYLAKQGKLEGKSAEEIDKLVQEEMMKRFQDRMLMRLNIKVSGATDGSGGVIPAVNDDVAKGMVTNDISSFLTGTEPSLKPFKIGNDTVEMSVPMGEISDKALYTEEFIKKKLESGGVDLEVPAVKSIIKGDVKDGYVINGASATKISKIDGYYDSSIIAPDQKLTVAILPADKNGKPNFGFINWYKSEKDKIDKYVSENKGVSKVRNSEKTTFTEEELIKQYLEENAPPQYKYIQMRPFVTAKVITRDDDTVDLGDEERKQLGMTASTKVDRDNFKKLNGDGAFSWHGFLDDYGVSTAVWPLNNSDSIARSYGQKVKEDEKVIYKHMDEAIRNKAYNFSELLKI